MQPRTVIGLVALAIAVPVVGVTFFATRDGREQQSRSAAPGASVPVPAGSTSIATVERPDAALPVALRVKAPTPRRTATGWQLELYDSRTTATAFAQAIDAAESGDLPALREIHDLLAMCRHVMEYVREGGSREGYLSSNSAPPAGARWREPFFDRCAAIATGFAQWPLTDGRLTATYWEKVGAKFDDPLLRSFAIAEDIQSYANAGIEKRPELRARMADNFRRVLRSEDATAWRDLGSRLWDPRLNSNKAVGIALIRIACDRGYDCTKGNMHNLGLQCDGSVDSSCPSATTLQEMFEERESADTLKAAQSLYERLTLLLDLRDWDEIERLIRLDGTAFDPEHEPAS